MATSSFWDALKRVSRSTGELAHRVPSHGESSTTPPTWPPTVTNIAHGRFAICTGFSDYDIAAAIPVGVVSLQVVSPFVWLNEASRPEFLQQSRRPLAFQWDVSQSLEVAGYLDLALPQDC